MATEKIKTSSEVAKGTASLPGNAHTSGAPSHVKISAKDKSATFEVVLREGGAAQIWVSRGTFDLKDNEVVDCTYEGIKQSAYRRNKLFGTAQGRLTLFGFALAIIGVAIDGSLKVGNVMDKPWIEINAACNAGLLAAASALQVIGLAIVFTRAFRRSDY